MNRTNSDYLKPYAEDFTLSDETRADIAKAADTIESLQAEVERLRGECIRLEGELREERLRQGRGRKRIE